MNIFLIGGSGYLGSHVTRRMIDAGHKLVGFARSDAAADKIAALGAMPMIGDLTDEVRVSAAVTNADCTIFAPQLPTQDEEQRIVQTMLGALKGSNKTFIFTSGTGVLGQRTDGEWSEDSFAEDDEFVPSKYIITRRHTELLCRVAAADGVRSMVIRPPMIWGNGYHGAVNKILESIEKTGSACYIGSGRNLYTQVHVDDLSDLFLLAVEKGRAGALYHAASGELNNRSIAEYVAQQQGVSARSISMSEAMEIWGKFTPLVVLGVSSRSRCPIARRELGWAPTRLDLVDHILAGDLNGRK